MSRQLIPWSEKYSVGFNEIDKQHKKLIQLINQLYQAFLEGNAKQKVKDIVEEMVKYTNYHFETEEKYFKQFNYEHTVDHIIEHQYFTDKVKEFQHDIKNDNLATSYKVMNFLRDWLKKHIIESDKKYIDCFNENNVQ